MRAKQPGRNGLTSLTAHLAVACALISLCHFEGAQGVHRIAIPQHPTFISRHYRDTSQDPDVNDDVNAEISLLESLLAYVAEQRKHNSNASPTECEDSQLTSLVRNKVKRALADEDYKTLYINRVREDLAKTLGEKKLGAMSDISEHLKKNYKDEARRKGGKKVKRELLNENYYKTLYIQKIADDIKADLSKANTKNIPVSKLNEIVKRELEDNFKSQYIAKVTNIVKSQLEQDLKQVAKRDARWNVENADWIRKEVELLYKLEALGGRAKRQTSSSREDLPADFKTLYIQRIADDVKREVVERNMTNVSVNKLNEIVKRELENNLKSDYVAKLTAFLKGQLEDTLRTITPDISRRRRQAHSIPGEATVLYVDPGFQDFLARFGRDLGSFAVDGNPSGDSLAKILQAIITGQFPPHTNGAFRVDDTKVESLHNPKTNAEDDSIDDKADSSSGAKEETGSANPYLPAVRNHDVREKTHHDKDKGVIIDGVPENEYFRIEPFDTEAAKSMTKGDEEEAKDDPPYMLNYYKRDHGKEHAPSDSCDNNATKKPCDKHQSGQAKKGKYCKVKVAEGGAPGAHHKPGGEGCSTTCSASHTTTSCSTTSKCSTTSPCTTTHRPGGKKCGNKSSPSKTKPKCPSTKPANSTDPVVTGDFVRFEIFNVNIPTRMLNVSSTGEGGGAKCGRRSSDGVSLAKGNRRPVEKVPVKVNYKGEKSLDKKTWHRRHNAEGKAMKSMRSDARERDRLAEKEFEEESESRSMKSSADGNLEDEDDKPMSAGRRRLLSWHDEEYDEGAALEGARSFDEDSFSQDLDVDWAKALAPHLSIRKRDLSTDPLNGYLVEAEGDGRTRVKRTADGFGDDDGDVRRNCFDDEVEVERVRVESDQQQQDGQGDEASDDLGSDEAPERVNRVNSMSDGDINFDPAEEDGFDGQSDAEIDSSFVVPKQREKRNSDGSLCVLLKATIKEDDRGDNETKLVINGKADYKLSVKNEGKEGVGNEATNLTMNGAANLNQEFDMPKQSPGEAMREISAELVDKLNNLGSYGGAERLMSPQDGGRRVGRVATPGSKVLLIPTAGAIGSPRVGRVVDGKGVADSGMPSVEDKSVVNNPKTRGAAEETKLAGNTEAKLGAVKEAPVANKVPVAVVKVAPIAEPKGVCRSVDGVAKVAVNVNVPAREEPAKVEVKSVSKMSRRSNTDLYQIGLGKLLLEAKRNKVKARGAGTATEGEDVAKLFAKVESALGMTDFQKNLEPREMDKAKLGGKPLEEVNLVDRGGEEKLQEKRSVTQSDTSRLRDLMDSFGDGNHHDDEIGKRDLITDLYESFGPVDAGTAEEFHVKKDLGPNALGQTKDDGKIEKRSVGERRTPRQRRGQHTERDFYDDLPDVGGDHVSRVEELLSARRARGRPSWSSLGLDIAGYVRDKRMTRWSAHVDDFQHMLRDIVQSHHDDQVAGFDGRGHYFNPVRFLKPVPDRRKRHDRAHYKRQLQPEEEDEMIDADGQACGGRRQEYDGQDMPPRPRPEKMSTDEPDDPGDCDEVTEEGAEASVGTSRPKPCLWIWVFLLWLCKL